MHFDDDEELSIKRFLVGYSKPINTTTNTIMFLGTEGHDDLCKILPLAVILLLNAASVSSRPKRKNGSAPVVYIVLLNLICTEKSFLIKLFAS